MINSLKTVALFGCTLTSRYRQGLCASFNAVAEEMGINMVYFNFLGKIGNKNAQYGDYEFDMLEYIDLDQFDGIIFDGEGYNVDGMAEKVIKALKKTQRPVVSISSHVDGFYNIEFEDTAGLRTLIEHFIDVHKCKNIGFMSGYLTHPDAQVRLKEFRSVMKEHGMPEDGAGVFEGDFWFHKGEEAADFFLSRPERPDAIVCANDYMAIALTTALKNRGINVPKDISVSGFDGTLEGQQHLPHITTATRERTDIARKSLSLLMEISDGKTVDKIQKIYPRAIYTQSCGCAVLDYKYEAESINGIYDINRNFSYNLYDAESSLLKLNKVENIDQLRSVFVEGSVNFGSYTSFFLMVHADRDGRPPYDSDYISPTGSFRPALWIDKNEEHIKPDDLLRKGQMIPDTKNDKPKFYYIMSVHCAERMFGYAVVTMEDMDIFNEFYNVWLLNLAMTLETLLKNDRIKKLIGTLEDLSIRDGLTAMLNRRGFDEHSRKALRSLRKKETVCTMVIDMDGLKRINDEYGHYEGDRAIKAAANIITKCCDNGEIAGRAGGDEFYIFATDYSDEKLKRFVQRLDDYTHDCNDNNSKPYNIELSYGTYLLETDNTERLEDLLKVSDSRMYEMKLAKPNRRK
ncbi:MAG: GGDEF domain-containing protein [Ruminococcus sp.]|nr:GGDEF domain-containing protein [Ruminococcus sp.]